MEETSSKLNPAYLAELKALNLPLGHYAIFGSGPLAVRGIREAADLDIIVSESLWKELLPKHEKSWLIIRRAWRSGILSFTPHGPFWTQRSMK